MNRRAFLFAGLAASTALSTAQAASGIQVIYVGGLDCPYCTMWKDQYRAAWLASPEYSRVTWIEVDSPKLREAYQDRFWPGALKDVLVQIPQKNGTPRFLIVEDGRLVSNELGVNRWEDTMTRIRRLVGGSNDGRA
jgi:hypothetical protein